MKAVPALALGIGIGVAGTLGVMHFFNGGEGGGAGGRGTGWSGSGILQEGGGGAGANGATAEGGARFPKGALSDAKWWAELEVGGDRRKGALRGKMVELLTLPHLSQRKRLFGALLEYYEPGDLEAIHAGMIDREKMGGRFNQEFEMMMERAAEVDGPQVMKLIAKESGGPGAKMQEWHARCVANFAAADAKAAIEWWNQLPDGRLRDHLSRPLIEGVARVDVEGAWKAAQMFEPAERARFAPSLATQFAKAKGVEQAGGWVEGLGPEEGAAKAGALRELSDYMHHIAPAKQAELYRQFSNEPWAAGSGVFEGVAENWARGYGNEAAAWAQTLPEPIRESTAYAAVNKWASKDPAAAGAWLEAHKGEAAYGAMAAGFLQQLKNRGDGSVEAWRERLRGAGQ